VAYRKCDECRAYMEEVKRDEQPKGAYITYRCPNDRCEMYAQGGHRYEVREFESSE
jgi:hypothetical protein